MPATLEQAEIELAELLEADPNCVEPLRSTKGQISFDDRAWLRIKAR